MVAITICYIKKSAETTGSAAVKSGRKGRIIYGCEKV